VFAGCKSLLSICIPASVEILADRCFHACSALSQIEFETGSKLTRIGGQAFTKCSSLISICIPAGVEAINQYCFDDCTSLAELRFEAGSKLTRITQAFVYCQSLRLIVIPSHLAILGYHQFRFCESLTELVFEHPCHLRQLDIPPSNFGSLVIPDCVEVVTGAIEQFDCQRRSLVFGRESRLMDIQVGPCPFPRGSRSFVNTSGSIFICVAENVLRRFRCQFECF
jgi:hypothetical protein